MTCFLRRYYFIGAREATVFGGLFVTLVTILTAWKVPQIPKFRWDTIDDGRTEKDVAAKERAAS